MAKNVQISLNHDELIKLCSKLNCTTDELGKTLKASILDLKHSPYFSEKIKIVESEKRLSLQEQVEQMTLKELEKHLGIKSGNVSRKLDAKGLYFQKNVEDYMMKFLAEWKNDIYKIPELVFRMKMLEKDEYVVREYLKRKNEI